MSSNKQVRDIMIPVSEFTCIKEDDFLRDAFEALDHNHWGGVFILNNQEEILGILTDGDARRILVKNQKPLPMLNTEPVSKFMIKNPKTIDSEILVKDATKFMNEKMILVLPVVDKTKKVVGLVHLQHAIRELI